jgi:hypothetical protein
MGKNTFQLASSWWGPQCFSRAWAVTHIHNQLHPLQGWCRGLGARAGQVAREEAQDAAVLDPSL